MQLYNLEEKILLQYEGVTMFWASLLTLDHAVGMHA